MNCEEAKLLLEELHDRNLEARLEIRVESHLANCPSCGEALERLQRLSGVLQKGFIPTPSDSLDRMVIQNIRRESEHRRHRRRKTVWWQQIFIGSVSVPKPTVVAALILIAVGLIVANLMGRNSANFFDASNASSSSPEAAAVSPPQPDDSDKTKIIEVPVVRERIVKQIVYVERRSSGVQKEKNQFLVSESSVPNQKNKSGKGSKASKQNIPDWKINDSIAENGYFTRTNLSVFQPVREMKTRIIKEAEGNEK